MNKTAPTLSAPGLDAALSTGALAGEAEERFVQMINSGEAYPAETLMPLFKQLEPVSLELMLGTWRGGKFDGGAEPDPLNWYGKRFTSVNDVEPILYPGPDGALQNYDKLGRAQIREMVFGGRVSAALIYDQQPIIDYFRKVNDDLVIGLGDIKGKPLEFFFHLTRDAQ
ncbi:DUF4334 domain-containing protein [Halopseudomonas maritima]|uniref:DUF4334 domain-containing protein n=1 Tax=Halopseudomonas maritima TaxID=2918528 RepID=UPI001EEC90A4|nr:DUF4334 domain-containing protein [Halopseudomonas maritima]UJJ30187.1 DUF4334 domain-containing protein [Halopseudomonas maritima]